MINIYELDLYGCDSNPLILERFEDVLMYETERNPEGGGTCLLCGVKTSRLFIFAPTFDPERRELVAACTYSLCENHRLDNTDAGCEKIEHRLIDKISTYMISKDLHCKQIMICNEHQRTQTVS